MNARTRLAIALALTPALALPAEEAGGNASAGRAIFVQNCVTCHGPEGHGDGPASAGLSPRPANFTEARRLASSAQKQLRVVTNGGASERLSPLMPAFGEALSEQQLRDVIAFVREALQAPASELSKK
jgi:mono/diheme cytochrome c family protein